MESGRVIEILERDGQRFARIVIEPNTVVEVPAADLTLGDRVTVESVPPAGSQREPNPERPRWRDFAHVVRMAIVFAMALGGFIIWRAWMVPADFGTYGHYRAGALAEIASRTTVYAGQLECVGCHDTVQEERKSSLHARISCETCHGPLGQHARGETDVAPIRPSTRGVCLPCHTSRLGMPAAFKKINIKEHSEAGPCTECHKPHTGIVF